MKKVFIPVLATAVVGFAALGLSNITSEKNRIELKEVQLQSTTAELKQLQLRYEHLNIQLDSALQSGGTDKQEIERLQQERDQLEKEKQELEKQVSAKQEAQRLAAEQINKAAQEANASITVATAKAAESQDNRTKWLVAVGIPESEWPYVDKVINGEAGWNGVTRWNTGGSGAYGICQSLPANKMASAGADWKTNGETQLRWCNEYMKNRYGTWKYAAQWKACTGTKANPKWCVNTYKPAYSAYKNHTWW